MKLHYYFCKKFTDSSRFTPHSSHKYVAFTLAEVLITLGIIGVISAITIPNFIAVYKAHKFQTQFSKSYSIIQQALKQMEADGLSLDPTTYATRTFYLTFIKYFKEPYNCEASDNIEEKGPLCFSRANRGDRNKIYKSLDGKSYVSVDWLDDGQFILNDGTSILIDNYQTSGHIWISVDLNGFKNPPNRWGYDLFTFELANNKLIAMGDIETSYSEKNTYCNPKGSGAFNGIGCTSLAISDVNYFKKIIYEIK